MLPDPWFLGSGEPRTGRPAAVDQAVRKAEAPPHLRSRPWTSPSALELGPMVPALPLPARPCPNRVCVVKEPRGRERVGAVVAATPARGQCGQAGGDAARPSVMDGAGPAAGKAIYGARAHRDRFGLVK